MPAEPRIAIIGLGYVGLPLAVAFARKYNVIGFDISPQRIAELRTHQDRTREVDSHQLQSVAERLAYSDQLADIAPANIYIITVPTPIDQHKRPDLAPLLAASRSVGSVLAKGDIVIYESTVYPGCTEEDCVPVLEHHSGLTYNRDFHCGYSPERINPGDREHSVERILKVTSGSTPQAAQTIDQLYASVITAGTHLAPSIRVAEAAKVIENSQRDINIAFVNELALIFHRLGIDTQAVLEAAATKWNFLPFRPGLVGGHCIGVDPYYLTHKAQSIGHHPEVILAGRRINDAMGAHVASRVVKLLIDRSHAVRDSQVLVLGITFKENCPDIRNSRVIDIIRELREYHIQVDVHDPWADPQEVQDEYQIPLASAHDIRHRDYQAIVLAVAHQDFADLDMLLPTGPDTIVFDVKGSLPHSQTTERL